jgi:sulfatase maturation enzyme AslB (radical SAM superfamily)
METERVYWKLFGKKMISYKKLEHGEVVGTGMLNPIINKLRFFTMIAMEAQFYKNADVGTWNGKRIPNIFAPPVGSRPQLRALKGLVKTLLFHRTTPVVMTFAVTYKCQSSCSHCSAGRNARKDVPELTTEEAMKLIGDSEKLGVTTIAFTGGEPLLRPDLFDLIAHLDPKKAMPIMFTNGQFLTEDNVQKLAGGDFIRFL